MQVQLESGMFVALDAGTWCVYYVFLLLLFLVFFCALLLHYVMFSIVINVYSDQQNMNSSKISSLWRSQNEPQRTLVEYLLKYVLALHV